MRKNVIVRVVQKVRGKRKICENPDSPGNLIACGEAFPESEAGKFRQIVASQLIHNFTAMGIHGIFADMEKSADLSRAGSPYEKLEYLGLPRREKGTGGGGFTQQLAVIFQNHAGNLGAEIALSRGESSDSRQELPGIGFLEHVSPGSRKEKFRDHPGIIVHGKPQHGNIRMFPLKNPGDLDAVQIS